MNANKIMYRYRYGIVTRIVDGDGIFIADLEAGNEFEIRLLGIDAPEISQCKKLIQDERETHLPGDLLRQLGLLSKSHLANLLPIGTKVSYRFADKNNIDLYRRLGFVAVGQRKGYYREPLDDAVLMRLHLAGCA